MRIGFSSNDNFDSVGMFSFVMVFFTLWDQSGADPEVFWGLPGDGHKI